MKSTESETSDFVYSDQDSDASSSDASDASDASSDASKEKASVVQTRKTTPSKGFQEFRNYKIIMETPSREETRLKETHSKESFVKEAALKKSCSKESILIHSGVSKALEEWVQKQGNCFKQEKSLVLSLSSFNSQFSCVFTSCGKKFKNYNGILYHLQKHVHSLSDITKEKSLKVGVFKVGLRIKFQDKKKIYNVDVLLENTGVDTYEDQATKKSPKQSQERKEYKFEKGELGVFPDKGNIQRFKRERLSMPIWSSDCLKVLNREEMQVFLPETEELKVKLKKKVHSIPLFKGYSLEKAAHYRNRWIINTGIAVGGLDYCPLKDGSTKQYLAVGGNKNKHENLIMGQVQFEEFPEDPRMAQMIQIWEIDGRGAPKMVLGLAHRYGCVFDLKWCPFEADGEQLGFLAASFGDGSCRVFSVPNPDSIKKSSLEDSSEEMIIVQFVSRFEVALPGTQLWKLDWVGPGTLVNGTTDGRVVVWNVEPYLVDEIKKEPEPMSIYLAHDCAIRKVAGCLKSNFYFITSGNDGRFLVHDIRQPFPLGQLLRSITLMTGICWSGSRLVGSDRDNNVRLCQIEEGSSINENTVGDVYAQIKTAGVMRHHSSIWDCDGSPYTPFVASSSSSLTIGNINRCKRHHSPVVSFLYSLAYDNVDNILEFLDQEEIPETHVSKISTVWEFIQPEVSWNKNAGHEFEIASGGRLGFVRLESCLKQ